MNLLDTCIFKDGFRKLQKLIGDSSTLNLKTVLLESTTNMATVATHVVGKTYSRMQSDEKKSILIVALAHSRQS